MSFGTLNDFAVNVKLGQTIHLVDGGCNDLLFCNLACNVIYAGNNIANLNGFNCLLAESSKNNCSGNKTESTMSISYGK